MEKEDKFKAEFKYFRGKVPKPDLSAVIDFDSLTPSSLIKRINSDDSVLPSEDCIECQNLYLRCHNTWDIYTILGKEGFIFVKNPFTQLGQQHWIHKALTSYPKKPSVTNLDAHYLNVDDIWTQQWSDVREERAFLSKLRWATFGYHHDWDTKIYSKSKVCAFPSCLKSLSTHIADCFGYKKYSPEAAIVNFYHMDSNLSGHVDRSEIDRTAPVISFSFGQTAVFLLGGDTKCQKPLAMFLRSGDIILMGGSCRLAYHAMPLIVKEEINYRFNEDNPQITDWISVAEYLKSSRININVRQVFPS